MWRRGIGGGSGEFHRKAGSSSAAHVRGPALRPRPCGGGGGGTRKAAGDRRRTGRLAHSGGAARRQPSDRIAAAGIVSTARSIADGAALSEIFSPQPSSGGDG